MYLLGVVAMAAGVSAKTLGVFAFETSKGHHGLPTDQAEGSLACKNLPLPHWHSRSCKAAVQCAPRNTDSLALGLEHVAQALLDLIHDGEERRVPAPICFAWQHQRTDDDRKDSTCGCCVVNQHTTQTSAGCEMPLANATAANTPSSFRRLTCGPAEAGSWQPARGGGHWQACRWQGRQHESASAQHGPWNQVRPHTPTDLLGEP